MKDVLHRNPATLVRHGLWLFGACVAAFSLFLLAIVWQLSAPGSFQFEHLGWGMLAVLLASSLSLGLFLLIGLHLRVLQPTSGGLEDAEQLIDRAQLMQSAIRPALALLKEGIEKHAIALDTLRRSVESDSYFNPGSSKNRALELAMRSMSADIASQKHIAQTVISANASVGLRLAELESFVQRMHRDLGHTNSVENNSRKSNSVTEFDAGGDDEMDDTEGKSLFGETTQPHTPKTNPYDFTSKPLLSDYRFLDEKTKKRFDLN